MSEAFINILNLSVNASIVVVAVLLLRLGMKKAPKWISVALWAFVGARLMFPFAVESRFSIIPTAKAFSTSPASDNTFTVYKGFVGLSSDISEPISTAGVTGKTYDVFEILALVWIAGLVALLLYGAISYIMLYLKIRTAVPLKDNIYQSEHVKSPFVLGFIKPRIFIPFNLDEGTLEHVLSHERAHIKRGDHITKPLAYILLSVHWFNPFIWLSYILLCRDIEVACDEKVIKDLSLAGRKNYALALLNCKVRNTTVAVCPVAFGEVSVTSRIKKTLKYKKPAMWVIVAAVAVAIIASGCLLTNPQAETYYMTEGPAVYNENSGETTPVADNSHPTKAEASVNTEALTEPVTEGVQVETENAEAILYSEYFGDATSATEAIAEPEIVTIPATEALATEPADTYEESEEYYYYEYDDSTQWEYVELQPLEIEPLVPSWVDDGNTYEHIGGIDSISGNQNNNLYEWDYSGPYPMPIFKIGEN